MRGVVCFTSATLAYLDRVRVLGETVRRYHPDWHVVLALPDEEPPGLVLDLAQEPFDEVLPLRSLGIADVMPWAFTHDVVELSTAVKGTVMDLLLRRGAEKVVYLDPDTALFSPLTDLEDLLDVHDVILTPHLVAPAPTEAAGEILDNEVGALKHGIYNLGFAAVSARGDGPRFARWWRDRLLTHCYDEPARGIFTDQRWCNLAPGFFPGLHVLRHPGYNVASWNLGHRTMSQDADGGIQVNGLPLRLFHFTKVTTVGKAMIERYSEQSTLPLELLTWYRTTLDAAAVAGLPERWWAYDRYADGTPIPRSDRRAYRDDHTLRRRFPDPFAAGQGSLKEFFVT